MKTDCTWFVSDALWAGGIAQTTRWQANSMNPFDWAARAAAHADFFKNAMTEPGTGRLVEDLFNQRQEITDNEGRDVWVLLNRTIRDFVINDERLG